jgi:cytochrome c553
MKNIVGVLTAAAAVAMSAAALIAGQGQGTAPAAPTGPTPPLWAYPVLPPGTKPIPPPPDDGSPKSVPGTSVKMTLSQIRDFSKVPDWHPDDHPAMPQVVAQSRPPDVRFGCGYCHLPNGKGRPENASLAGLPAAYIIQQMADYRNGLRRSSEPRMGPPSLMLTLAKAVNEDEIKTAAAYFSALKWTPWIKVIEAKDVPKTRIAGGMFIPLEEGGTEPLGQRILEMPEHLERTELRDSKSGFLAYVPVGSIKRGEALVTTGGKSKTVQCGVCHGADLKGMGPVPGIAGRSPSYTMRQLFDIKHGARNGLWADLMKPVVAKLTDAEMIDIVAYTASRTP